MRDSAATIHMGHRTKWKRKPGVQHERGTATHERGTTTDERGTARDERGMAIDERRTAIIPNDKIDQMSVVVVSVVVVIVG